MKRGKKRDTGRGKAKAKEVEGYEMGLGRDRMEPRRVGKEGMDEGEKGRYEKRRKERNERRGRERGMRWVWEGIRGGG